MPRDANKADSKNHIAIEPLRPDLLTAPSTQPHPPIIRSAEHLPLHDPNWKAFEQLMVAILRECHKWRDVREYGVRGQKQHGIDLLGYASDVSQISSDPVVLTCQCKDVKSFTANDLKTAVEIFAQGYRPLASRHIAIAVSCATEDTALIEELNRLRIVHCDLTIDLWGQNQICDMLKNEHEIVRRFFGIHWANAFCTPDAEETKTPPKAHIRQRLTDFASHAKEASLDRLLSRWLAVGLDEETALEFARDGSIGCHPQLLDQVSICGFHLIVGDFGSGKSVLMERIHQRDLRELRDNYDAFLPIRVEASEVADTVESLCARTLEGLALPAASPVRLIIDGLDEVGPARADEIILSARSLALRRPNCRIIATIRPGICAPSGVKQFQQPLLTAENATSLVEQLAGIRHFSHNQPLAIIDAIRRPLFALIAAALIKGGAGLPRSTGGFLEELVKRAIRTPANTRGDLLSNLGRLAELTVAQGGGAVPMSELNGISVDDILATRLVVASGRSVKFAMPILEQYFAGAALLEDPEIDHILDNMEMLDRWRYGFVLAVTTGSWPRASALLEKLVGRHPGFAAWVVNEAIPEYASADDVRLPSSYECAKRLHRALKGWTGGLSALSKKTGLLSDSGRLPTVGARAEQRSLIIALRHPENASDPEFAQLPNDVNILSRHKEWMPLTLGSSYPVEYGAWPWRTASTLMSRWIEKALENYGLDGEGVDAAKAEFNWLLARTLVNERGRVRHDPIEIDRVLPVVRHWLAKMDHPTYRFVRLHNAQFGFSPRMLADFAKYLENVGHNSEILTRPYVVPNVAEPTGQWIWNIYTPEAMHTLCSQVFSAALSIYADISSTLFASLTPTLGMASLLPVKIKGLLEISTDPGYEGAPTVAYCALPIKFDQPSSVEIALGDLYSGPEDPLMEEILPAILHNRPKAIGWARTSLTTWAFSAFKERPATHLALGWLHEDLNRLRLVKSHPRYLEE